MSSKIFNRFVNHVKENGRCFNDNGHPLYYGPEGNMCSIGLFWDIDPEAQHLKIAAAQRKGLANLKKEFVEFDYLPMRFWSNLQLLHDTDFFWESDGSLNDRGLAFANKNLKGA